MLPENSSRRQINRLIRQLRGPPPPRVSPATNALLSTLENYRHEVGLYAKPAYQVCLLCCLLFFREILFFEVLVRPLLANLEASSFLF